MSNLKKVIVAWKILFVVSFTTVILMIVSTYSTEIFGARSNEVWKEYLILWFYFTFWSNILVALISLLSSINKTKHYSVIFQRLKIMMAVNILITGIIYWALLGKNVSQMGFLSLVTTILAHAIVPIFAISIFTWESFVVRIPEDHKVGIIKTSLWNSLFPIIWFFIALILYFSLGGGKPDAVYSFLDFNSHWVSSLITVITIALAYPAITIGASWLYSR